VEVDVLGKVFGWVELNRIEWKKPEEQLAVLAVVALEWPVREHAGVWETPIFLGCWMWGDRQRLFEEMELHPTAEKEARIALKWVGEHELRFDLTMAFPERR
jgi:hypothetical protein